MAKVKLSDSSTSNREIRPALTPEAEENQCVALAVNLVKQRLMNGTASSQETVHFLKLASSKSRLEQRLLETEIQLKEAKTKQIESEERREELFTQAIEAMRRYGGHGDDSDGDY